MYSNFKTMLDLTHTVCSTIPTWDGTCGFSQENILDYVDCTTETQFRVQHLSMNAGIGTHMDAPAHCIPGSAAIDTLELSSFLAPCVVIDVRADCHETYSLSTQTIEAYEQEYGIIPKGSLVACNTGWDTHWHNPQAYRNNLIFPSISQEAAQLLASREIVGIAIDTLGVDRPFDDFPAHRILLSAGIYIIENATNLDKLPPVGAYTLALPIKIAKGTEAPIRFIGFVE
jgi:kynurenine formamidase